MNDDDLAADVMDQNGELAKWLRNEMRVYLAHTGRERAEATSRRHTSLVAIYDGRDVRLVIYGGCVRICFLLLRGKAGVEAFDADERSIGIFPDTKTAAAAVSARWAS